MSSRLQKVYKHNLITPPKFLPDNIQYEVVTGSVAYGVSDNASDMDIAGFAIPPKRYLFPHTEGYIHGFDNNIPKFGQYQKHGIKHGDKEYDFCIYSIIKFFRLMSDGNPNMIDMLFVPRRCVLHSTQVGEMVREKRKLFLHKGLYHRFKGYAYSQLSKLDRDPVGKRKKTVEKYGYDLKFAYHLVRLLNEIKQILEEKDLDLERSREQLKSVRRGEWEEQEVRDYFKRQEKRLEKLYDKSHIPYKPPMDEIKQLLINCLEHHYGNLSEAEVVIKNEEEVTLEDIDKKLDSIHEILLKRESSNTQ